MGGLRSSVGVFAVRNAQTNVETDLALFLSLTARCVPVAPSGALGSVDEAIARSLALPESTSRRTQLRSLQRSNGGPGGAEEHYDAAEESEGAEE